MNYTRTFRRFDTTNLKANYFAKEGKTSWKECTINKVSRKGIGIIFHTDEKINAGSTLDLKIFISKELDYFTVKGILKWIKQNENDFIGGIELTEFLSETEWIQLIFFITTPSEIRTENIGFTTPEDTRENRHQSPPRKVVLPAN
jgi:hypothetical protein